MSILSETDKDLILAMLSKVKPTVDKVKNDRLNKNVLGENFNLFDVMGINEREVYICRVIGELLDPKGCHGLDSIFLSSFIENVLDDKMLLNENLSLAKVLCEDSTHEGRRIDITIQIGRKIIPIEAKIKANDQVGQCADYIEEIQRRLGKNSTPFIYYLTIDGHRPSSTSMAGTHNNVKYDVIKCITWKCHILPWLLDCLNKEKVQRRTLIHNNIWQLVDVIRGWGDFMDNELLDIINSEAYINEAIHVWHVIDKAKNTLWDTLVSALKSYMQSEGIYLEFIGKPGDKICDFVYKKSVKENDKEVIISLVLYSYNKGTFIGFRTFNSDKSFCGDICAAGFTVERLRNELPSKLGLGDPVPADWKSWIYREKFPPFLDQDVDFVRFNNQTLKLLCKESMDSYVKKALGKRIKKFFNCMKEAESCGTETQVD